MSEALRWHNETVGKKVAEALEKNFYHAEYVPDKKAALARAIEIIPVDASIGIGGSISNKEIGLLEALAKRGNKIIDAHLPGFTPAEEAAERRRGMIADVFVTSTNAVTLDGQLINVDGTGNRVAAMVFGPKKVVLVVGVNKIVTNIEEGINRIKFVAAPANNKRLNIPNPCTVTGVCMNCNLPTRICRVTTIMHKCPSKSDITVLIVGESLGF